MTTVVGSGVGEAVAVGVASGLGIGVDAGVDGAWVGVEVAGFRVDGVGVEGALVGVGEGTEVGAGVVGAEVGLGVVGRVLGAVVGAGTEVDAGVDISEEQAANQIAIKMANDNVSIEDRRIDMETPFSSFAS